MKRNIKEHNEYDRLKYTRDCQTEIVTKPRKSTEQVTSCSSLLSILLKIFEKMFIKPNTILNEEKLIPSHQFGYSNNHGAIEKVHRAANTIIRFIERKRWCSVTFLDITQVFNKM